MDKLLSVLNSDEMNFYIRHTSRDYQNGWKSYAKSFIQNFGIPSRIVDGLDDIGLTLDRAGLIKEYEEKRKIEAPWLFGK